MCDDKVLGNKEIWISYENEGQEITGFFVLIEQTLNYVKIQSGKNILTIPYHKINKMKERIE